MIDPKSLLPHESVCRTCKGEKFRHFYGPRPGSLSVQTEPEEWTEPCEDCDGTGVQVNERRATPRLAMDDQLTRLVNIVTASRDDWRAEAVRLVRENERLRRENRRLREAVHTAAQTIERNQLRPSPAESTPMSSNRAVTGGFDKEVQ